MGRPDSARARLCPALGGAGALAVLLLSGCSQQPDLPTLLGPGIQAVGAGQVEPAPHVQPAAVGCPNDTTPPAERRPANT